MKILAKLYRYNANTNNKDTNDCVARSISLALGIDYDEVKRGLKKVAHKLNLPSWNYFDGFTQYIREHVGYNIKWRKPAEWFHKSLTVKEFSQKLDIGTYLLLCGKAEGSTSHMVACIDGNYYDSWDSSNRIVSYFMVIDDEGQSISDDGDIDDISMSILDEVDKYIEKLNSKFSYFHLDREGLQSSTDDYTKSFTVVSYIRKENLPEEVEPYSDMYEDSASKTFYIKLNPRMSDEANIQKNAERLRYQIREWNYANRKTVEDVVKEAQASKNMNKEFKGDRLLLSKTPKEYQKYILRATDSGSSRYTDRYSVSLYALPNDPNYNDRDKWVTCYCDSIRELIYNLKYYFSDFKRVGYDY